MIEVLLGPAGAVVMGGALAVVPRPFVAAGFLDMDVSLRNFRSLVSLYLSNVESLNCISLRKSLVYAILRCFFSSNLLRTHRGNSPHSHVCLFFGFVLLFVLSKVHDDDEA